MTTTTDTRGPYPNVPLPSGADFADIWEGSGDAFHRVIMGDNRGVIDTNVIVWTSAIQLRDGNIDTGGKIDLPALHVDGDLGTLNSDQARELAAALIAAANEVDGWAAA